jgi:hypothetical protein
VLGLIIVKLRHDVAFGDACTLPGANMRFLAGYDRRGERVE